MRSLLKRWGGKKPPNYLTDNVNEDLIRLEDLVKVYDTGALKVLGLKRVNLTIHRGGICGGHGPVRVRQVHVDEYIGLPGQALHGPLLSGRRGCGGYGVQ